MATNRAVVTTAILCSALLMSGCSLNNKGSEMNALLAELGLEDAFGEPLDRKTEVDQFSPEGYTSVAFGGGGQEDYMVAVERAESIGAVCDRYPIERTGEELNIFVCEHDGLSIEIFDEKTIKEMIRRSNSLPGFGELERDSELLEATLLVRVR